MKCSPRHHGGRGADQRIAFGRTKKRLLRLLRLQGELRSAARGVAARGVQRRCSAAAPWPCNSAATTPAAASMLSAHLALLSKGLHAQQDEAEGQALQQAAQAGAQRGGEAAAASQRHPPRSLAHCQKPGPLEASLAVRPHHSCELAAADAAAGRAPLCSSSPSPLPQSALTMRVMAIITPDTPKMKPASSSASWATSCTPARALGCTAAARRATRAGRAGRKAARAAGLLQGQAGGERRAL